MGSCRIDRRRLTLLAVCVAAISCRNSIEAVAPAEIEIAITPCPASTRTPVWVAVQDGEAPWTSVLPTNGAYTIELRSGRAGVARVFRTGATNTLEVLYASAEELTKLLPGCGSSAQFGGNWVSGRLTGLAPGDDARVAIGGMERAIHYFGGSWMFSFSSVPAGPVDLVAARRALHLSEDGSGSSQVGATFSIRRGLVPKLDEVLPVIDLAAPPAIAAVQRAFSLDGTRDARVISVAISLVSPRVRAELSSFAGGELFGPTPSFVQGRLGALPADRLADDERQEIVASASDYATFNDITHREHVVQVVGELTDQILRLGPRLDVELVTRTVGGVIFPQIDYPVHADYRRHWSLTVRQLRRGAVVSMTRGYLGTGIVARLTVPDLTTVPDFNPAWMLSTDPLISWSFLASDEDIAAAADGRIAESVRRGHRVVSAPPASAPSPRRSP